MPFAKRSDLRGRESPCAKGASETAPSAGRAPGTPAYSPRRTRPPERPGQGHCSCSPGSRAPSSGPRRAAAAGFQGMLPLPCGYGNLIISCHLFFFFLPTMQQVKLLIEFHLDFINYS